MTTMTEHALSRLTGVWPPALFWPLTSILALTSFIGVLALFAVLETQAPLAAYITTISSSIGTCTSVAGFAGEYYLRRKHRVKLTVYSCLSYLGLVFFYGFMLWQGLAYLPG